MEAIREAVLSDVDAKVTEKAEEMWLKGKQMLNQLQQKHRETTTRLTDEVARCHEKQRSLEAENDRLKQVIPTLAARLSVLGDACSVQPPGMGRSPGAAPAAAAVGAAAGAAAMDGAAPEASPRQAANSCSDGTAKLPEVPKFPFLSQAPGQQSPQRTPLSLASSLTQTPAQEAIGTLTPQRTPLSLASSLTPTAPLEVASPFAGRGAADGSIFSFTLRKADGADLGLNVSHHEHDQVLRVEGVRPDGAVEAWNRQCAGSASAEKAVNVGDKIISVNGIAYDPQRMLEECRDRQLLKLTIVRGDRPLPAIPAKASPPNKSTALRADASVFVPMSTDGTPDQAEPEEESQPGLKPEGAADRA